MLDETTIREVLATYQAERSEWASDMCRDIERLAREDERRRVYERCAGLHESVDPASDGEELARIPGAGAMGAVIRYRDLIREAAQSDERANKDLFAGMPTEKRADKRKEPR